MTVQGQDGVTVTGLFPSTRYQVVVTAFLNGAGTSSAPVQITTGPEGPAAPTNVRATARRGRPLDDHAGTRAAGITDCVPRRRGRSSRVLRRPGAAAAPPAPVARGWRPVAGQLHARRTNRAAPGPGLNFTVGASGAAGHTGRASASSGCGYSWTPPDAGTFHLRATAAERRAPDGTSHTRHCASPSTATRRSPPADRAPPSVSNWSKDGASASRTPRRDPGDRHRRPCRLNGIDPGQDYTVRPKVNPPAQSATPTSSTDAVDLDTATATWPPWTSSASWGGGSDLSGPVNVVDQRHRPAPVPAATVSTSTRHLTCGNTTSPPFSKYERRPDDAHHFNVNRLLIYGNDCQVQVTLDDQGRVLRRRPRRSAHLAARSRFRSRRWAVPTGFNATWDGTRNGGKYGTDHGHVRRQQPPPAVRALRTGA